MNKRTRMLELLEKDKNWDYIPSGFFTHFGDEYKKGQAAVNRHIDYFRSTGMDFLKIQFEQPFPTMENIKTVNDWDSFPFYDIDYYQETLAIVKSLVQEMKKEALIIMTAYSPFMNARSVVDDQIISRHLEENPEKVAKAIGKAAESILLFVSECKKIGVDGFYASTQGGESGRFQTPDIFEKYIKPMDLAVMDEMNKDTVFNILHICDFRQPYESIQKFTDYPCQIVSMPAILENGDRIPLKDAYHMFGRPVMGGLDRLGPINGEPGKELTEEIAGVLAQKPDRFILSADCTVPDAPWESIKFAIDKAHAGL